MIGIIAGTGFYEMKMLRDAQEKIVKTAYGEAKVYLGNYLGKAIVFMPRHGKDHSVPPHLINYRANLKALADLGVKRIVAINAVGSLKYDVPPASLVLINDFLDFTHGRENTYFTGGAAGVGHVSMTEPYCQEWQRQILKAAQSIGVDLIENGVYVTTQGPRFESPAEIKMFRALGGTVVGMTGVPEVTLAGELGMCYGAVSVITNFGSGMTEHIAHGEVIKVMNKANAKLTALLEEIVKNYQDNRTCECDKKLNGI